MDVGGHPSIFLSEPGHNYQSDIVYLPHPSVNNKNAEQTLEALNTIFTKNKFPKNLNVDA
jgi:hypothetical protein